MVVLVSSFSGAWVRVFNKEISAPLKYGVYQEDAEVGEKVSLASGPTTVR